MVNSPDPAAGRGSARALSAEIAALYASAPAALRLLQTFRPYVAPFDDLLAAVPQGAHILDVGCGGGLFLNLLAARGTIAAGQGIDASAAAIVAAQAAAASSGLDHLVRFDHRTVQQGLPDGTWPVVTLIDVIHHLPRAEQAAIVQRLAARVAPGGRLILRDPVRRPYWRQAANQLHDLVLARQWVHARDPETVIGWLADSGLALAARQDDSRLVYGYWMLVFERPVQH